MPVRQALLAVFACRNATVHEEAMLAAGALTYACGPQFVKYMERFFPVLQMGLTNHQARPPPLACQGMGTVDKRPELSSSATGALYHQARWWAAHFQSG